MAWTGLAVAEKIADAVGRITGVSLAAGAAGTIGLAGSGAQIELPASIHWGPYDGVDLAEAVEVSITPEIPLTVAKQASPFLVTVTNDQPSALGAQSIVGKMSGAAAQTVADGNTATVDFTTEDYDVGGCVDVVANAFTAPVTGKYLITANVAWSGTAVADGLFQLTMLINGAAQTTMRNSVNVANAGGDIRSTGFSTVVNLNAGDVVTFQSLQDTGAPQDMIDREATFSLLAGAAPGATPNLEIYLRFH